MAGREHILGTNVLLVGFCNSRLTNSMEHCPSW